MRQSYHRRGAPDVLKYSPFRQLAHRHVSSMDADFSVDAFTAQ